MIESLFAAFLYADVIQYETPDYRFLATPTTLSETVTRYDGIAHLKTTETPGGWSQTPTEDVTMFLHVEMGGTCIENAILPFDQVAIINGEAFIIWTENLATGTWTPRNFTWEVHESCEWGNEELAELLAAWGTADSKWDLDGDGEVGGMDLALFLGGW